MTYEQIVYIVDDDEAVRKAVGLLLKSEGLSAEQYASADEFLDGYYPDKGGCLLVDVRMPGKSGLELQEVLADRQINIPTIIMTGHGDIEMAVKAMKAGAIDFIEKPFKNQMLLDRIHLCLAQAGELYKDQRQWAEANKRLALLTDREREVMDLLVTGKLNKQIAAEFDISIRTVEAHRAKIKEKLKANSLSDIVRISIAGLK